MRDNINKFYKLSFILCVRQSLNVHLVFCKLSSICGWTLVFRLCCDDEAGDCCSHVVTPTPKVAFPGFSW